MSPTAASLAGAKCSSRRMGPILLSALLATGLAGCGTASAPQGQATVTVTAPAPPPAPGSTDVSPQPTDDLTPEDGGISGSPVAPAPGQITLASFFNPQDWKEDRYDVADRKQVQGVLAGLKTPCISNDGGAEVEMRLGAASQRLNFAVGQSQDSASSREVMTVRVFADNGQVDLKKVPFGQIQTFDLDVARVNALRIRFNLDSSENSCSGEVPINAVLFDGTLQ